VAVNKDARVKAAKDAQGLLQNELQVFDSWRDSLETVPTIKALRAKAEFIRNSEVERSLLKLGGLSKKQLKIIEELSKSVVNKLLHGPMASLRCDGKDSDAVGKTLLNMEALERMFLLSRAIEEEKK
jgi:glutamyl-tRNA reductase